MHFASQKKPQNLCRWNLFCRILSGSKMFGLYQYLYHYLDNPFSLTYYTSSDIPAAWRGLYKSSELETEILREWLQWLHENNVTGAERRNTRCICWLLPLTAGNLNKWTYDFSFFFFFLLFSGLRREHDEIQRTTYTRWTCPIFEWDSKPGPVWEASQGKDPFFFQKLVLVQQ